MKGRKRRRVMEYLVSKVEKRYPDITLIVQVYDDMVEKHKKSDPGTKGDSKYRLGLLKIFL